MARIVLSNANRSGVLSNVLTEEVLSAREVDDCMVVSVGKHKTAWTQGPAKIVLTKAVYSWSKLFVSRIVLQMCNRMGSGSASYALQCVASLLRC